MQDERGAVYARATEEIRRLKADCEKHYYDLGLWLVRVADEKLYAEGGYASLNEYLAGAVDLARSTAFLAMRVARNFSRETSAHYGLNKLDAVLAHLNATPEADTPADLSNQLFGGKTIDEATTEEIREATRALRAQAAGKWPPEVAAFVERFTTAMPGVAARVSISEEAPGIDFGRVGFDRLCELAAALRAAVPCR